MCESVLSPVFKSPRPFVCLSDVFVSLRVPLSLAVCSSPPLVYMFPLYHDRSVREGMMAAAALCPDQESSHPACSTNHQWCCCGERTQHQVCTEDLSWSKNRHHWFITRSIYFSLSVVFSILHTKKMLCVIHISFCSILKLYCNLVKIQPCK